MMSARRIVTPRCRHRNGAREEVGVTCGKEPGAATPPMLNPVTRMERRPARRAMAKPPAQARDLSQRRPLLVPRHFEQPFLCLASSDLCLFATRYVANQRS